MSNQDYLFQLLLPLASTLFSILCQILWLRWRAQRELLHSVFFGLAMGLTALLFLSGWWPAPVLGEVWPLRGVNLILFLAANYCYLHYLNIGEASLRIRLLKEIEKSPGGLSREKIEELYSARTIVDARLRRLSENGQIDCHEGRYRVARGEILRLALFFRWVKKIFFKRPA
jgi:hypothetical protein